MPRPRRLQEMKASIAAFFSLTPAYRTEIDFFFCILLFLLLFVQHFVSAAQWSRERGEGTVCHSFINNSSSHLVFLGVVVFFHCCPSIQQREEQFVSFMDDAFHAGGHSKGGI